MRRAARFVAASCVLAVAACDGEAPAVAAWEEGSGYRSRPLDIAGTGAGFTELRASRSGVTHRNDVSDATAMANRNLLIGAGVAIGDVDGDGYPDLFLASPERPAALYRNEGGLRFRDITEQSGIRTDSLATIGATFADVNGDGDLDLLFGTLGGPLKLWANDGAGNFSDVSATSGLVDGLAATTLTLADVDHDGDLDLYVATYKKRNALDAYPPQARAFDQVVTRTAMGFQVRPEWVKEFRLEDRPDLGGIVRSQRADVDLFFLNDGGGRFERVPIMGPRFGMADGRALAAEPDYFTLAARFYDVNGDGNADLYACNDFEDPDQFWLGDGKGNFRLVSPHALAATSNTCMSVDFGDVDRDGRVDLFTADMLSPTLAERQARIPTHTPMPKPVGVATDRPQWMRNMLQVARGDGSWMQIADFAGVAATDWTWGSAFVDVDLDGLEDLIAVNGHRWDIRDADTFDRIRNSFPRVAWDKEQGEFPESRTRSVAFRNNGDLTFVAMPRGWGLGASPAMSQGLALADLDLDGDLDAVVSRLNAPAAVMRNDAIAPRVSVRLVDERGNTAGIGATVTVRAASLPTQGREITAGGLYLSGSDATLTFATGSDSALTIEVRWPDGRWSVVVDARPNRHYEIRATGASAERPVSGRAAAPPEPLFVDATALLGGHTHHETIFDDFARQSLLPQKFSQLGPGLAWTDADGDGRDDLLVGSGRGGTLTLLSNAGGRFRARALTPAAKGDLTTLIPLVDGRGGMRVIAGQSNYEMASFDEALRLPSVVSARVGTSATPPLDVFGGDTASVGAISAGDVNGDGLADLFVAPRAVGGAWPLPARSRLLLGEPAGTFREDPANTDALRSLGLVAAAVLADLDDDGDLDLAVAVEFGPVRVLSNEGGRLTDHTAALGLGEVRSRWNGLAVGDFDGDGRADLVATSWGRNVSWQATSDRPYTLFAGRFGGSSLGLVFARRDSATGKEMPLESFARLGVAFPGMRTRVATYHDFARLSVDGLFGSAVSGSVRIGATTFDHTLFLSRGGRFEARPLPAMAQLAPAFGVSVADFDGDGREDLFLAQNFSPTAIESMRFDAGAGLVLLGDGAGGFRALSVLESGVVIRGDQRGSAVADFDGDGRTDLAVSQNGATTTLWRNSAGVPGLRVSLGGGDRAYGARIRVEGGDGRSGAARWLLGGSGAWSTDARTVVLARPIGATALLIRWPNGVETRVPLADGTNGVTLTPP